MDIHALIDQIPANEGAVFSGDKDTEFFGLTYRVSKPVRPGQFLVLVDESWGKLNVSRYELKGSDLNDHIQRARTAGIAGFICNPEVAVLPSLEGANIITAAHTLRLAYRIAEVIRDNRGGSRITAITGSAGKSTTKAMLTHALSSTDELTIDSPPHGQNIFASLLSHYSRVGQTDHSVLEVAGSCFRPFQRKGFQLAADVSIVTSIAEAHLDYLGSLEGIAQRKSDIFNGSTPGGTAVINADTPHSDLLIKRAIAEGRQLVTYGESTDSTIQLVNYDLEGQVVTARVGRQEVTYSLGAAGHHMALNSLAVLATIRAYRLPAWRAMLDSLATFAALPGRGDLSVTRVRDGVEVTLIDEAYNANPGSMRASLRSLHETRTGGRRVAVLGDMLELGDSAQALHDDLAVPVEEHPPATLHLYGPQMRGLQARLSGFAGELHHWEDLASLAEDLRANLNQGDTVLIKGSQSTGLHKLVKQLRED
jgi:UDP-N-acetylmuramoyl-tripeptide--D-alanyl-D-alanine ligase